MVDVPMPGVESFEVLALDVPTCEVCPENQPRRALFVVMGQLWLLGGGAMAGFNLEVCAKHRDELVAQLEQAVRQ